ncbi:hypothetical protein J4H86_03180 [Spiractinospora alimapuensis]|uniref:hypothetical protein n=1 Tax=Spiractinospora alimapuensis TaxID=2820884 RepID=UPI001F3C9671|nr:hypothetical protein [Spiractinospora alimapuensis]QVQ52842.1 hypothetical protein J4H86_03180 [Spiractinospora alimapuensis]
MSTAVVVGGTGMLAGVVESLAGRGWSVVVPSRRGWRGAPPHGVRWVRGEWSDAEALASSVRAVIPGPVELLVAWVHTPHRGPVLRAFTALLARSAPVVEVWGSAGADPLATLPEPTLPAHPTHQVVLGYARAASGPRWLTDAEIADGVASATERAFSGSPPGVHEVGTVRPWPPQ